MRDGIHLKEGHVLTSSVFWLDILTLVPSLSSSCVQRLTPGDDPIAST